MQAEKISNAFASQGFLARLRMMTLPKLFTDSLTILLSNVTVRVITFIQVTLLIRYFGPEQYGLWRTAFVLPSMLGVMLEVGTHSYFLREVAKERKAVEEYFPTIVVSKLMLMVLFVTVLSLATYLMNYPSKVRFLVAIIAASVILDNFMLLTVAVFRGYRIFRFEALINLVTQLLLVLFVVTTIYLKLGLEFLAWCYVFVSLAMCSGAYIFFFRRIGIRHYRVLPLPEIARFVRKSSPFLVLGIIVPIYFDISTIVLSKLSGFEDVGIYNAAYRIIFVIMILPLSLYTVFFPNLSDMYTRSRQEFVAFVRKTFKYICIIACPVFILLLLYADIIVRILFGHRYDRSVVPLQIMSFAILFSFLCSIFSVSLNATMNEKKSISVLIGATLLNVALNVVLVRMYSVVGAAIATSVSEMARLVGNWLLYRRIFGGIGISSYVPRALLASLCAAAALVSLKALSPAGGLIVGASAYLVLLRLTGMLDMKEIRANFRL
jgi:O-antigen/teichoic acid export membrane protein